MNSEETTRKDEGPRRSGPRKDPRLEGLISDWKKGEKDKWRGHGKKDFKKKK